MRTNYRKKAEEKLNDVLELLAEPDTRYLDYYAAYGGYRILRRSAAAGLTVRCLCPPTADRMGPKRMYEWLCGVEVGIKAAWAAGIPPEEH